MTTVHMLSAAVLLVSGVALAAPSPDCSTCATFSDTLRYASPEEREGLFAPESDACRACVADLAREHEKGAARASALPETRTAPRGRAR